MKILNLFNAKKTVLSMAVIAALTAVSPVTALAGSVSGGDSQDHPYVQPITVVFPQPMAQISSKGGEGKLVAGQEFVTEITIKNKGIVNMERPVVTVAPSDQVLAVDNTNSSFEVKDMKPGDTQSITLRWKMAEKLTGNGSEINVGVKFYYNNGSGLSQGTDSGKILLNAQGTDPNTIDSSVPNVIVQDFTYGGQAVAAGEDLDLEMTFRNTGKARKIENLVISAENGEGISLRDSANTFYFESLGAGKDAKLKLPLKVSPLNKNTSAAVIFHFKYEYVDNNKRSAVSSDQTVMVPVYQKDRFTLLETVLPQNPISGEEQNVSIKYVNEGKGDVSNVKAKLTGDGVEGGRVQYLGNFEPGKSGSINFLVTPAVQGKNTYSVHITYEDANLEEKEIELPFVLEAGEPAEEMSLTGMEYGEEPSGQGGALRTASAGAGMALAAVLAAAGIVRGIKRKKIRTEEKDLFLTDEDEI